LVGYSIILKDVIFKLHGFHDFPGHNHNLAPRRSAGGAKLKGQAKVAGAALFGQFRLGGVQMRCAAHCALF